MENLEKKSEDGDELERLWEKFLANPSSLATREKLAEMFVGEIEKRMKSRKDDFSDVLSSIIFEKRFVYQLPQEWPKLFSLIEKKWDASRQKKNPHHQQSKIITPAMVRGAQLQEWREMRRAGFDEEEYKKFVGNDYP